MDGIFTLKPSEWMEIVVILSYPRVLIYSLIRNLYNTNFLLKLPIYDNLKCLKNYI